MKGNRSAGGQRGEGNDCRSVMWWGGNQSVGSAVWRSQVVISNDPESVGSAEKSQSGQPPVVLGCIGNSTQYRWASRGIDFNGHFYSN